MSLINTIWWNTCRTRLFLDAKSSDTNLLNENGLSSFLPPLSSSESQWRYSSWNTSILCFTMKTIQYKRSWNFWGYVKVSVRQFSGQRNWSLIVLCTTRFCSDAHGQSMDGEWWKGRVGVILFLTKF